jgi:hypothetical protein
MDAILIVLNNELMRNKYKYATADGLVDEGWETDSDNSFRQTVCIMSVSII